MEILIGFAIGAAAGAMGVITVAICLNKMNDTEENNE